MTDITGKMDKLALRQRYYKALHEFFEREVEGGTYLLYCGKTFPFEETSVFAFE